MSKEHFSDGLEGMDSDEQQQPYEVTHHDVVGIFLQSFYISQGSQELQKQLFVFIRHLYPNWRLTESVINELVDSGEAMGSNLLKQQAHNSTNTDPRNRLMYYQMAHGLKRRLEDPEPQEYSKLLKEIFEAYIKRDHRFLMLRPDRKHTQDDQPVLQKKHFSQVCHFILLEHSIKVPEFDLLFEEFRGMLIEQSEQEYLENISPEHVKMLQDLVVQHNRHTDEHLVLPGFLA